MNAKPIKVIYSNPVTIVFWDDNTKTISKCDEADTYNELTGFMLCMLKKNMPPKNMRNMLNQFVYGEDKKYIKRNVPKQKKKNHNNLKTSTEIYETESVNYDNILRMFDETLNEIIKYNLY